MIELNIIAAFLAGLISFLSPCVLPLVPGFLAYLAGVNSGDYSKKARKKLFVNSLIFVLGFSLIFAGLGILFKTLIRTNSYYIQIWLSRIGGAIIVLFGLYVLKIINIPFLEKEHKLKVKGLQPSYVTSFIFGAAFAVGWTPCIGAILGAILTLAITNPAQSFYLLMSYAIGLGIPFLIVGIFSSEFLVWITKNKKFFKMFNIIVGIFLVILGILIITQTLNRFENFELLKNLIK